MNHGKLSYEQEQELTNQLLNMLDGQWDIVLPRVIPEISEAIAAGHRRHVDCILPGHVGKRDFRITKHFVDTGCCICSCTEKDPIKSGIDLVMRVRGVTFIIAKRLLMDASGSFTNYEPVAAPAHQPRSVRHVDHEALKRESQAVKNSIISIWDETVSLKHESARPALLWFHNRGLLPLKWPLADVRFHPSLKYYDGDDYLGSFPAIVSMIRDNKGFSKTIHRTYITSDGRKPSQIPSGKTRKLFTVPNDLTASGSAVRIDEPTNCLNLGEGLETMLSVRLLNGLPTWACLSKDLLRRVELPDHVKFVTVWADKDRSDAGQRAAKELVERLLSEGRKAVAMLPPGEIPDDDKSLDWNGALMSRGAQALREDWHYRQWDKAMQSLLESDAAPKPASPSEIDDILSRAFTS